MASQIAACPGVVTAADGCKVDSTLVTHQFLPHGRGHGVEEGGEGHCIHVLEAQLALPMFIQLN